MKEISKSGASGRGLKRKKEDLSIIRRGAK